MPLAQGVREGIAVGMVAVIADGASVLSHSRRYRAACLYRVLSAVFSVNRIIARRASLAETAWLPLEPEKAWHAGRTGKRGHPETCSDGAAQTCSTSKGSFGPPLRRSV